MIPELKLPPFQDRTKKRAGRNLDHFLNLAYCSTDFTGPVKRLALSAYKL
jgi:hypothetical protein